MQEEESTVTVPAPKGMTCNFLRFVYISAGDSILRGGDGPAAATSGATQEGVTHKAQGRMCGSLIALGA